MKPFLSLPFLAFLWLNFQILIHTTFSTGRNKKKAVSSFGALALFCGLMLLMSVICSFSLAAGLAPIGGLNVMLMAILFMGFALSILFTLLSAQGVIYSTKDVDLVLSFPISSFSVMLARLMALYLEVLLIIELFLLPAGIAYLVYGGAGGIGFLLLLLLCGVLLAFIPTCLGLVFGALISLLVSRIRHKSLFTILFSLAFVVLIMAGALLLPGTGETMMTDISGIREALGSVFPPIAWAVGAAVNFDITSLLLLFLVCMAPMLFFIWLFSRFYKSVLSHLASYHLKNNFKLRSVAGGTPGGALFRKEAAKFFGTPVYILNCGMSVLLGIILAVIALVNRSAISEFLAQMAGEGVGISTDLIPFLIMAVVAFLQCLVYTAAVSISLEGKNLWILKEAPIGTGRIFATKAGFNFLLSGLTVLITAPILCAAFYLSFGQIVAVTLMGILFAAFSSLANLIINLLFPRMDAENDTLVVKQSSSALFGMLASLVCAVLLGGIYFLLRSFGGGLYLFTFVAGLLLVLLCAGLIALLNTKGRKLFAAL